MSFLDFFEFLQADKAMQYALVITPLVALCSSLLGVTLVVKRFSLIGDGLSHVAFGAMAIATVCSITDEMLFVLPVTVLCAVLLLRVGDRAKMKGDASIALISVSALAIGYFVVYKFPPNANFTTDVCGTLFGSTSIYSLGKRDLWTIIALSVVVVGLFVLFYNKIFAVTFDEDFARATGVKAGFYNLLIAVIIAVVIVLAMKLVGSLLVSALIVFPALSAMRVFKTFLSVTVCSVVLSLLCSMAGFFLAPVLDTPLGPTIVIVDIITFILFYLAGYIKKGVAKK